MASRSRTKSRPALPTETSSGAASAGRRLALVIAAALVVLTAAAYTPVWQFAFVSVDDPGYVSANPDIADGVSARSLAWALTTGHEANWHPLTWISHIVDVQLFGVNAGPHHAINLIFHIASTLLLFGVFRRMTGAIGPSAFVAAVFALHPLHVESVAWVAERKDVLSAFFFMLTLGAYGRYVTAPSHGRYAIVGLCLAAGLLAKAMLVTAPMVLLLMDYWPLKRVRGSEGARVQGSWRELVLEKVPLLMIVLASSIVTYLIQRQGGALKTLASIPRGLQVQNVIVSYVDYLGDAFWPAGLGIFYPFPPSIPVTRVAVSAAILIAVTAAALRWARRAPYVVVGWLWFVGMLVPVIGFVHIGGHARADRYMYLPLIGLSIALAWGAVAVARSRGARRAIGFVGAAAVLTCAVVTHAQVQHWRDTFALWTHTASVTDDVNNFGVYFSLGEYLRESGRPADAIPYYETAVRRNPAYADSHLGLGRALLAGGQVERAIPPLAEAVRLRPDGAEGQWRLALALASTGRLGDALPAFAAAARLDPASAAIRSDYGWTLAQLGQTGVAREQLNEALRLKPDFVDAHHNLGRLLAAQGDVAGALTHLTEAVRLEPAFADARVSLALALLRAGRADEAATQLKDVLQRDPRNAAAARALAAIGR